MIAAERLQKLLLMLSSNQDGEVVNAARAIDRTLRAEGVDWHDLAGRLVAPARARAQPMRAYHSAPRGTRYDSARGRAHGGSDYWRKMHSFCLQHPTMLSQREADFINNISRWRGDLTEKQYAWLAAIHARLQNAAHTTNTAAGSSAAGKGGTNNEKAPWED